MQCRQLGWTGLLGGLGVLNERAGGPYRQRAVAESEPGAGADVEVLEQGIAGGTCFPTPAGQIGDMTIGPAGGAFAFDAAGDALARQQHFALFFGHKLEVATQAPVSGVDASNPLAGVVADEDFGGLEACQFAEGVLVSLGTVQFATSEFAGAQIGVGQTHLVLFDQQGHDVIVGGGIEATVDHGAGGDDAHDLAFDHPFGVAGLGDATSKYRAGSGVAFARGGFADLFGDGDAVAGRHQFGDV